MTPHYDEFELTDSAYRHGFSDEDFAEMLRGRHLAIKNRRGRLVGYEIFGRNRGGAYLLAAGRLVESVHGDVFRVFHLARMSETERRRFQQMIE
jgi:hypothetical protein